MSSQPPLILEVDDLCVSPLNLPKPKLVRQNCSVDPPTTYSAVAYDFWTSASELPSGVSKFVRGSCDCKQVCNHPTKDDICQRIFLIACTLEHLQFLDAKRIFLQDEFVLDKIDALELLLFYNEYGHDLLLAIENLNPPMITGLQLTFFYDTKDSSD
jgi:hypothetical protein